MLQQEPTVNCDFITPTEEEEKDFPRLLLKDLKFIRQLEEEITVTTNGHYEMPLPFKLDQSALPDNRSVALKRLDGLKTRLQRDEEYRRDYVRFMSDIIGKGFAEKCEDANPYPGQVWYKPHHGAYHPKKKKIACGIQCEFSAPEPVP